MLLFVLGLNPALAQDANPKLGQERLLAPAASMSAENSAATPWVNPALMGFDPDANLGAWYQRDYGNSAQQVALSTTAGGTGLGLQYRNIGGESWWGLNSAVSVRLPQRFNIGANLTWNLPEHQENFVTWDLGVGWRPLPWLGLGGVARNIGNQQPDLGVWSRYGASMTVRPAHDVLEVSFDYEYADDDALTVIGADNQHTMSAILRLKPTSGLVLRAQGDTNPDLSRWSVGAGLEVYLEGLGAGAYTQPTEEVFTGYLLTGPLEENIFGAGKEIPVIDLDRSYPYQSQAVLFGSSAESYVHLLERLEYAADSKSVKGMVLDLSSPRFSWAQLDEIKAAVEAMQAKGKPVVAFLGGQPGSKAYYLASVCDKVYLHPAGGLDLIGMSMEMQYFAGALDLVGVDAQYVKREKYKSAPEQWTNTEPSDGSREQTEALLDDLFNNLVAGIGEGRDLEEQEVLDLIDGGPYTAQEALDLGLVDALIYPDQLDDTLEDVFPRGYDLDDEYRMFPDSDGWRMPKQVAIVYVTGPITGGESSSGGLLGGANTGSDTVVRYLRQAAKDNSVKAVVLRVDSPGGSAYASDEIWRAIELLKDKGKPVIVSMGGVAASGGYYVAAGADAIFAEPTTITGSIGVYSGKYSFGDLYEKLGVSYTLYLRGRKSGMYSMSKPLDEVELAAMDRMVGDTYLQFKTRVSQGRDLTMDEVEEVARGRVWSGTRAKEAGLVDEIGGLMDAVDRAKAEAGLDPDADVQLVTYRGQEDTWGDVPQTAANMLMRTMVPTVDLPPPLATMLPYATLADEGELLLMPYIIEVN
ncbi:MAG: signal peptide peptidase SppA [Myxococcota bacterium]|nr:signal peptide peptidase SppA [Myxococcota bacterium]